MDKSGTALGLIAIFLIFRFLAGLWLNKTMKFYAMNLYHSNMGVVTNVSNK